MHPFQSTETGVTGAITKTAQYHAEVHLTREQDLAQTLHPLTEGKNAKDLMKNPNHAELVHVQVMHYIIYNTSLNSYQTVFIKQLVLYSNRSFKFNHFLSRKNWNSDFVKHKQRKSNGRDFSEDVLER